MYSDEQELEATSTGLLAIDCRSALTRTVTSSEFLAPAGKVGEAGHFFLAPFDPLVSKTFPLTEAAFLASTWTSGLH